MELRLVAYALIIATIVLGGICAKLYVDLEVVLRDFDALVRYNQLLRQEHDLLKLTCSSQQSQHAVLLQKYASLISEHRQLQLEHDSLLTLYSSLVINYTSLKDACDDLQRERDLLLARLSDTEALYRGLEAVHAAIRSQFTALLSNYTSLETAYRQLKASYDMLSRAHQQLQAEYGNLWTKYTSLNKEYGALLSNYNDLLVAFTSLDREFRRLQAEYGSLQSQFNALQLQYDSLLETSVKVNGSLTHLVLALYRYCCIPYAFERVLNPSEIKSVDRYVASAGVSADDIMTSIQNIYRWIRFNVRSVQSAIALPMPIRFSCDARTRLCYFQEIREVTNYVQNPSFTASYGLGDSDDQAVLAYAMIKHYFIYVHKKEYDLWIAYITMGDGSWRLAVFLPALGGKLTIVDPAGAYLTSTEQDSITSRPAHEELARYSTYWSANKGITHISLFRVDVSTGKYTLLASGNMTTIASYIRSAS